MRRSYSLPHRNGPQEHTIGTRMDRRVHYRQIPQEGRPFLDHCGIKGTKDRNDDAGIAPGVRKFVLEHARIFKRCTCQAELTVSGETAPSLCLGWVSSVCFPIKCHRVNFLPQEPRHGPPPAGLNPLVPPRRID